MERYLRYFDKNGYRYHVWGSYAGGTPNVYAEDPTGDTVQIDANWDRLPVGAADDALMNQCSQGNCSGSVSSACGAALQGRCGSTTAAGLSMLCYDCTSQHFGALVAAGTPHTGGTRGAWRPVPVRSESDLRSALSLKTKVIFLCGMAMGTALLNS
eukprot:7381607-Prymnesium_polylepis.1